MTEAKIFMEQFMEKLNNGYFDTIDDEEWLVEFVNKLYHKDMKRIKIDLDMYECGNWPRGAVKRVPAGSWVYVYQDEGGVLLYDDTKEYCYSLDYDIAPEEIFYD